MRLILASQSPRRADLLRAAAFSFETLALEIDETVLPGETPAAAVRRLAQAKSAAAERLINGEEAVILAADTLVAVNGAVLGKPSSDGEAREMMTRLSGRAHEVATGVSVRAGGREASHVELTTVFFAPMSTEEIAFYVQTGEGRDKAGGYAIQGVASRYVERIEGSYSNVVGLPVAAAYRLLRRVASEGESELF